VPGRGHPRSGRQGADGAPQGREGEGGDPDRREARPDQLREGRQSLLPCPDEGRGPERDGQGYPRPAPR